jgi:hydrogenase/urease accessory protein HupE
MTRVLLRLALCLGLLMAGGVAQAHESRPAYLEINELVPGRYAILWRTPLNAGTRLPIELRFPAGVRDLSPPAARELSDSFVESRVIESADGLAGKRIGFPGLQGTITDVLVRISLKDGSRSTELVHPSHPWVDITARSGPFAVAGAYVRHGIEHILTGYDHLMFVFCLVLIVRSRKVLFFTITSFTVAHSITLALATLGVVHVPGPPVEATIALSILLLASEIVRIRQGASSLTQNWPWVVAFTFGLLHGFGFASALSEVGLPQTDIPLALLSFNVGVEIGQLIFVAAIFAVMALLRPVPLPARVRAFAPTAAASFVGCMAAFWFIERVASFAG